MKMKRFSFLLGILCAVVGCGMVACKGGEDSGSLDSASNSSIDSSVVETKPQTPLAIPKPVLNSDYSISWEDIDGASAYVVNVNGEDLPIKNTMCYLQPFTAVGDYQVKVKALRGAEETSYSQIIQYSIYSIEFPSTTQFEVVGLSTAYSGKSYSFEVIPKDETYDFSKMSVYANGKKVLLNDNIGIIEEVTEDIVITVEGITPLTSYQVTKSEGEGYSIIGKDYALLGKEYTFQIMLHEGFTDSVPVVKVNGTTLQAVDGVYTLKRVVGNVNIVVTNVTFSGTIVQELFRTRTWTEAVEVVDGYVTIQGSEMTLPINWLKKLIGDGYTHLTFKAKINNEASEGICVTSAGTTLRSATGEDLTNGYVFRVDLSNVKEFDLTLMTQNTAGVSLSIGDVQAYKYTEEWNKTSKLAYVCEENGQIVVDTYGCGENVEVYKTNAVRVLGGVNAVLVDENSKPTYFNVVTPNAIVAMDMDYYASISVDEANSTIRMIVLKDEGSNRPIVSFEQSKHYVKAGSPYVNITVQSQETNSVEYVYGDNLTNKEKSLVYKTTQFACELVTESYKGTPFQMFSTTADVGAVVELCFVESSFENEFYTSNAWSNINGGSKAIENGQLSVTDSWQLNLSAAWLRKLYDAGYRTLEFDVKLLNVPCIQQYDTSSPCEGYFQTNNNGIAHIAVGISATEIVFRGKLQEGTDYNDPTAITAFSVLIYNVKINK